MRSNIKHLWCGSEAADRQRLLLAQAWVDAKIAGKAREVLDALEEGELSTHALTTLVMRVGATARDRENIGKALRRLEGTELAGYVTLVPGQTKAGTACNWRRWHKKTVDKPDQSARIKELEAELTKALALAERFRQIANQCKPPQEDET